MKSASADASAGCQLPRGAPLTGTNGEAALMATASSLNSPASGLRTPTCASIAEAAGSIPEASCMLSRVSSVFIYGSCVSRDPFESPNDFNLEGYFARSSIGSALSRRPTSDTKLPDVEALASRFQKRMVQADIIKLLPEVLVGTSFDVLIVDFIDERMNTLEVGDTTITDSEELKATGYSVDPAQSYEPWSALGMERRLAGIGRLVDLVEPTKIIVNRVYWSTVDTDGVAFPRSRWFDRNNRLLYDLYKEMEKTPGVRFIDYPGGAPLAATDHRWGRQPFHYSHAANVHFLEELKRLTES